MAKQRCKANTKRGTQCTRRVTGDLDTCLAHAPKDVKDARGFGGAQKGSGPPRKPRINDRFVAEVDQRMDELLRVYTEAIQATKPVGVGRGEDFTVREVPDHAIRLKAVESMLDRAHGRPRQSVETTGKDGGPIRISEEAFGDPKLRKAMLDVAKRIGDARADKPGRAGPGD